MIYSKASGLNDSIFGKSQEPIKMLLESMEELHESESMISKIFNVINSDNFAEKFSYETAVGDFKPTGEGGEYPKTNFQEGYSKVVEPEVWKLQWSLTQEMVEDAKVGTVVRRKAAKPMQSYYRTREKFGANLLSSGIATSMAFGGKSFDISGADGKALFATDHPSKTGGSAQTNLFNLEFTYENLAAAESKLRKQTDDDGNLLNINPNTIIIPDEPAIRRKVVEVLSADGKPGSADNDGNYHYGKWTVKIWGYLTDPTGMTAGKDWWMLQDEDFCDVYETLIWIDRVPLQTKSWIDDNNDNNVFNMRARYGASPNNWRGILACIPGLGTSL